MDTGGDTDRDRREAPGLSPEEAFKILGNETRVLILRTLWEADGEPVGFSALYRRTGVEDSGQFNYHLDRLVDHFVTTTSNGYELTTAGAHVVRSVVAGTATERPTIDPVTVNEECPVCGSTVRVRYEHGTLSITCAGCEGFWPDRDHPEGTLGTFSFPPAALRDRAPRDVLRAGALYLVEHGDMAMKGVCPTCAGRVERTLKLCSDHDTSDGACETCGNPFVGILRLSCSTCRSTIRAPSFTMLYHHPTVESMYSAEPGLQEDPWTWMWRGVHWEESVVSEDPPRFRIVVEYGGERHRFEINSERTITQVE